MITAFNGIIYSLFSGSETVVTASNAVAMPTSAPAASPSVIFLINLGGGVQNTAALSQIQQLRKYNNLITFKQSLIRSCCHSATNFSDFWY